MAEKLTIEQTIDKLVAYCNTIYTHLCVYVYMNILQQSFGKNTSLIK